MAIAALPALAWSREDAPVSASFVVTDTAFRDAAGDDATVEIAAGGSVGFSYPVGESRHNVVFSTLQPTSCKQTAGDNWGATPPLPWYQQGPGWAGTCTFDTPGTYEFHSGLNFLMKGTIVVSAGTPTATPTETATPTQTPTATPTVTPTREAIVAHDTVTPAKNWFQDASSSDPADNTVTVLEGSTVDFSYPTGASAHNVKFDTNPTSCVQKTGVVILPAPPLPASGLPAGWSGECTFATPGVYTFVCSVHPVEMTGSVVVTSDNGSEPTPTPTPTATATATATPTVTATPEPPRDTTPAKVAKPWAAIDSPTVKAMKVSSFLSGKLKIVARCVSAGSGTLKLTISKAVANQIGLKGTTKLGSAKATCNAHGRFTVKVKPNAAAKAALGRWKGSVKVTATLTLAGPIGQTSATRTINLKGKGRK